MEQVKELLKSKITEAGEMPNGDKIYIITEKGIQNFTDDLFGLGVVNKSFTVKEKELLSKELTDCIDRKYFLMTQTSKRLNKYKELKIIVDRLKDLKQAVNVF